MILCNKTSVDMGITAFWIIFIVFNNFSETKVRNFNNALTTN